MDLRQLAQIGEEAFNNHDMAALGEHIADDCTFWSSGDVTAQGRDACLAANAMWFQACSDARVTITGITVEGDTVVEEGIFDGTHDGVLKTPMGDIPPTGRKIHGNYVNISTVRGDKITAQKLYIDRMQLAEQLGLMPAATSA